MGHARRSVRRTSDHPDRRASASATGIHLSDPESALFEAIADGQLDDHLTGLAEAIHARQHLLHTVRSATALSTLCVGDRVRVNRAVSPRYLIGLQGTVVDVDDQAATIRLQRPVGRFKSGQVRCPPLALDKLNATFR